jgi:hypothetical protein
MTIGYSDLHADSLLRKRYVDIALMNTASTSLSAGYNGWCMVPFNSYIHSIIFANDADITASNGIVVSVCNATTDAIHLKSDSHGILWSASMAVAPVYMSGSVDFSANAFCEITSTLTTLVSRGSMLHFTMSATAGNVPIAITLVTNPDVAR